MCCMDKPSNWICIVILSSLLFQFPARASAAEDAASVIESGLAAYKNDELGKATQQLTYALQLINDKYGRLIIKTFPQPLPGWKAGKAKHQMSPIMMGGGVTASQTYTKGQSRLTLQLVKDSPLLQSLLMVMNNPMMMGVDGGKIQQVNGYNAIVKFNETRKAGELSMIIENRFLVLIKTTRTTFADMLKYAESIDVVRLKQLVK